MKEQLLKNICAVFLAGFMVLLLLPQSAQAQKKEAYVVKSSDKKTLTFYYDAQKSSRTGTVWGIDETKEEDQETFPAWAGTMYTAVPEVTTVIFDLSFKNFLPKTTKNWFFNFTNLEEIKGLENLNSSEVTIMSGMFVDCEKLSQLNLSNFNTEKVQDMSNMFYCCKSLSSLNLSSFNTEKVQDMCAMFFGCSSLTFLNLSNFNTEKVENMHGMFYGCKSLSSLNISSFNTEKVQYMSGMFSGCSSLTFLNLSNFNTEKVENMHEMFCACSSLSSLDLSTFYTEKVQDMSGMFGNNTSLRTIYCNNTWNCALSNEMFYNCTSLKGAVRYNANKEDVSMANPNTGYFTKK